MKKERLSTILAGLMIFAGLSLLLYPTVSNILKTRAFNNAIATFRRSVEELPPQTHDDIRAAAHAYNEDLTEMALDGLIFPLFGDVEAAEYYAQMNIPGTDVMGYVSVPKAGVTLPIYHGTSEDVLQNGVGHMEGSSLPVGGESTHTVLTGHRGLPSATLFTHIDRLAAGDTFSIYVFNEVLTYQVDQVLTVLPSELGELRIVKGQDLCTLVTCTPYGVNTHRLLVRGHRIPTPDGETANLAADVKLGWLPLQNPYFLIAALAAVLMMVYGVWGLVVQLRALNKGRKNKQPRNQ